MEAFICGAGCHKVRFVVPGFTATVTSLPRSTDRAMVRAWPGCSNDSMANSLGVTSMRRGRKVVADAIVINAPITKPKRPPSCLLTLSLSLCVSLQDVSTWTVAGLAQHAIGLSTSSVGRQCVCVQTGFATHINVAHVRTSTSCYSNAAAAPSPPCQQAFRRSLRAR